MLAKNKGFLHIYNSRSVYSLYYDDIFLSSVKDNLAGISNRTKSVRSYSKDGYNFMAGNLREKSRKVY